MLSFFNNNQFSTIFLLLGYLGIFAIPVFLGQNHINPEYINQEASVISQGVYSLLGQNVMNLKIAYALLFILQAFLLNSLVNSFRLAKKYTYITGVSYAVIMNICVEINFLSPLFIANFFIIFALYNLFALSEKKISSTNIYNLGFFIGLAILSSKTFWIWLPLAWLGLIQMRTFDWKEHLIFLLGFLSCFFLMGTWQYVWGDFAAWWSNDFSFKIQIPAWSIDFSPWWYASITCLAILALWSVANLSNLTMKTGLKEQKSIFFILVTMLLSGLAFLTIPQITFMHWTVFALPMSLLLSLNIHAVRNPASAEIAHLVLFLYAFALQFSN